MTEISNIIKLHPRKRMAQARQQLSSDAWYILCAMAEFAGKEDTTTVSVGRLAKDNSLSHSRASKAIRELVDRDVVKRIIRPGHTNFWKLNIDPYDLTPTAMNMGTCRMEHDTHVAGDMLSGYIEADTESGRLLSEFLESYSRNVDPGYKPNNRPDELKAAEELLALYPRETISRVIEFVVLDKCDAVNGKTWRGWAFAVRSLKTLLAKFKDLEFLSKNSTVGQARLREEALAKQQEERKKQLEEIEQDRIRTLANPDPEIARQREEMRRRLKLAPA